MLFRSQPIPEQRAEDNITTEATAVAEGDELPLSPGQALPYPAAAAVADVVVRSDQDTVAICFVMEEL